MMTCTVKGQSHGDVILAFWLNFFLPFVGKSMSSNTN